jgi:hypothetical protein
MGILKTKLSEKIRTRRINSMNRFYIYFFCIVSFFSCQKFDRFRWNLISSPEVKSLSIESNSLAKFELIANFSFNGHDSNAEMGFCFSNNNEFPTINDDIIIIGKNKTGLQKVVKQWINSTPIYCRAFIKNQIDTVYSNSLLVNWPGGEQNKPIVTIDNTLEFSFYWVKLLGEITYDGGLPISDKGFQICKESTFSNSSLRIINTNISGTIFFETINNLEENTGYFVRAFATNTSGTSYSAYKYFVSKNYYNIGEIGPAGGFIFYNKIDTIGGWNFLECSSNDISNSKFFSTSNELYYISGLETLIGSGKSNTNLIINSLLNVNSAAWVCQSYSQNGFDDWFLPSRDELIKIYQNVFLVNPSTFVGTTYWTSSQDEIYSQNAWIQKMNQNPSGSGTFTMLKSTYHKVRPIRCF